MKVTPSGCEGLKPNKASGEGQGIWLKIENSFN